MFVPGCGPRIIDLHGVCLFSVTVLDSILQWATLACCAVVVAVSPWLFASWEAWWFWPFAVMLFIGLSAFSLRLTIQTVFGPADSVASDPVNSRRALPVVVSFLPFLGYAFVGWCRAAVFTDAERNFLLFLTPCLLGILIAFGLTARQRTLLYRVILTVLVMLGVYGIVNHLMTGSRYVMWVPGYPAYVADNRLTGTYFCPDHFAGVMELALCLALGILLAREAAWKSKCFAAALVVLSLATVILTKSRGGGLTVLVVFVAALAWGFPQWSSRARWAWRVCAVSTAALAIMAFCSMETSYTTRFKEHFGGSQLTAKSFHEKEAIVAETLRASPRGRMYAAALRAWRTHPLLGIGPGMHQNLWPHFAASPDGDRELGAWPSMPNYDFHSYEVHSDWIQLLEEHGAAGLILFLLPVFILFRTLLAALRREKSLCKGRQWRGTGSRSFGLILGAVLAGVAMTFHSFGDFNLQMPATVWLLAAITALALAEAFRLPDIEPLTRHTGLDASQSVHGAYEHKE